MVDFIGVFLTFSLAQNILEKEAFKQFPQVYLV